VLVCPSAKLAGTYRQQSWPLRLTFAILGLIIVLSLKWPLMFLGILVLGLAYCVYRIVKDRKASNAKNTKQ
jgi:hypothetical protein